MHLRWQCCCHATCCGLAFKTLWHIDPTPSNTWTSLLEEATGTSSSRLTTTSLTRNFCCRLPRAMMAGQARCGETNSSPGPRYPDSYCFSSEQKPTLSKCILRCSAYIGSLTWRFPATLQATQLILTRWHFGFAHLAIVAVLHAFHAGFILATGSRFHDCAF